MSSCGHTHHNHSHEHASLSLEKHSHEGHSHKDHEGHDHAGHGHGSHDHGGHCHHHHGGTIQFDWVKYIFKANSGDPAEARWVFGLACFLSVFAFMSVWDGLVGDNLHEVSEGFHIGFHVLSFCAALASIAYTRENREPSGKYSYGSDRFEVIATFGNSMFLIFIASFALMEIVHGAILSEETSSLQLSSIVYVKFVAEVVVFAKLAKFLDRKTPSTPTEDNLGVIGIHCFTLLCSDFIDLIDSFFGLSASSGSAQYFSQVGLVLCSIVAIYMVKPYIELSGRILLQCAPQGRQRDLLVKAMRDVKLIEGVLAVREEHFWQYTDDKLIASLSLKVHPSVDHNLVVSKAQDVLRGLVHDVTVEVSSEAVA